MPSSEHDRFVLTRLFETIDHVCGRASRVITLQVLLIVIGLAYFAFGEQITEFRLGIVTVPGPLVQVFVFGMLLKLHMDWGYLSFRYLLIRRQIENLGARVFGDSSEELLHPSIYHYTINPSFFETLFSAQEIEQRRWQPPSRLAGQLYYAGLLFPVALLGASWAVILEMSFHHIEFPGTWTGAGYEGWLLTGLSLVFFAFSWLHYHFKAAELSDQPTGGGEGISDARWFKRMVRSIFLLMTLVAILLLALIDHDHSHEPKGSQADYAFVKLAP